MSIAASIPQTEIAVRDLPSAVTVDFPPTVDLRSAHALRCRLLDTLQERPARLVVDMSEVDSFDVTAAAVLVGARRRLRYSGGRLQLVNVNAHTAMLLRQLGLTYLLRG